MDRGRASRVLPFVVCHDLYVIFALQYPFDGRGHDHGRHIRVSGYCGNDGWYFLLSIQLKSQSVNSSLLHLLSMLAHLYAFSTQTSQRLAAKYRRKDHGTSNTPLAQQSSNRYLCDVKLLLKAFFLQLGIFIGVHFALLLLFVIEGSEAVLKGE